MDNIIVGIVFVVICAGLAFSVSGVIRLVDVCLDRCIDLNERMLWWHRRHSGQIVTVNTSAFRNDLSIELRDDIIDWLVVNDVAFDMVPRRYSSKEVVSVDPFTFEREVASREIWFKKTDDALMFALTFGEHIG